jgi:hypothetical protein
VAKNTYVLTGSAYRELPSGGVGEEGKQCEAKTRARDGAALEGPGQQTETAGRRCGPGAAAATHHLFFRVYRWRPAAAGLKDRGKFQERREKLLSEAEGVDGSRTRPSRPGGMRM